MTTSSSMAPSRMSTDEYRVEIHDLHPLPELNVQALSTPKTSCCSSSSCCGGRKIRWQQYVSASGIVGDVAEYALYAFVVLNPWQDHTPLGLTLTIGLIPPVYGILVHSFSTFALWFYQPRKDFEDTVSQAKNVEKQGENVAKQTGTEIADLKQENAELAQQLAAQSAFAEQIKRGFDEKVHQLSVLTGNLESMKVGLDEARNIAKAWEETTKRCVQELTNLHPENLARNVDGLAQQTSSFQNITAILHDQLGQFDSQAKSIQETQTIYGKMLEQLTSKYQSLSTDLERAICVLAFFS